MGWCLKHQPLLKQDNAMIKLTWARTVVDTSGKLSLLVEKACGVICVFCFAVMTLVAILGVFFRYVMQSPFMWTEEVARYLLVWLGFTAVSMALRQDRHIKVEVITNLVPGGVQKIVRYIVDVLIGVFFVVLLWQGYKMTVNNIMTASTIPVSMSWILVAVPVGAALALVQLVLGLIQTVFEEFSDPPETQITDIEGKLT